MIVHPQRILTAIVALVLPLFVYSQTSSLKGKRICIDPGHGGTSSTDQYRKGKYGEREEWINLRVALMLRDMLKEKKAEVLLTRAHDNTVSLAERATMAKKFQADVFVSIHHNATADSTVNFPVVYFHGAASENQAGALLAKFMVNSLRKYFYRSSTEVSVTSDHTIFPDSGAAVLRYTYGIPAVLSEASFFTNENEEKRLRQKNHNHREALAFLHALEQFFSTSAAPVILEKKIPFLLPPFPVLQEADRMKPEAFLWYKDFREATRMMQQRSDTTSLFDAYQLFTRSARSFPDSYVAGRCHEYRAQILRLLKREREAELEKLRAAEFYVPD